MRVLSFITFMVTFTLIAPAAPAQTPSYLGFQGFLTKPNGEPVDSSGVSLTFTLYKSSVQIWSEPQAVNVTNGVFDVSLGSSVSLDTVMIDASTELGIKLDGEPSEMTPRTPFTSVASAFQVRGMTILPRWDGFIPPPNINCFGPGDYCIGIGTNEPRDLLDIRGASAGGLNLEGINPGFKMEDGGTAFGHADGNGAWSTDATEGDAVLRSDTGDDVILTSGPSSAIVFAQGSTGFVGINTNVPTHPLEVGKDGEDGNAAHVTTGGTWVSTSSRHLKEKFVEVDVADVLTRVANLPIQRWQYKLSSEGEHLGPMAEDFSEAFSLGDTDKAISMVDADGVALAAIQGLYRLVKQQELEIGRMRAAMERAGIE